MIIIQMSLTPFPLLSTDPKKANVGMLWEADQDAHRRIAAHRPPSATSIHSVAVETEEEDEAEVVRAFLPSV